MQTVLSWIMCVVLMAWVQGVYAHAPRYTEKEQQILAVTQAWGDAVNAHDADAVVALYNPHAYFFPTFATHILTYKGLQDYFVKTLKIEDLSVNFITQFPRTDGNFGMNSGLYIVKYRKQNDWVEFPAHYMFVFWKTHGQWTILEQRTLIIPEEEKVVAAS